MQKVAFIHGRPKGHPVHANYAKSIDSDFFHEDRYLRWHDNPSASKFRRYCSWLMNALLFTNAKSYDIFLTECIRIPQLLMKKLGLIRKSQKLIALMGDESLYFLSIKRYPFLTRKLMLSFLNSCDVLICTSRYQADLAKSLHLNPKVIIKPIFNGLRVDEYDDVEKPELRGHNILYLGNVEADWRVWYKGLDLAIESAANYAKMEEVRLSVIGSISKDVKEELKLKYSHLTFFEEIQFLGSVGNLLEVIPEYDLLLHPARGEAWGVTIHMALACGVPAIISSSTGTKEIVEKINSKLIATLEVGDISSRIAWYFGLSQAEREDLSNLCREIALTYSSERSLKAFANAIQSA